MAGDRTRVAVVTGGAIGIGAAIAESLGRQGMFVVTMDPVVALDGSPQGPGGEVTTADRIVAAGGKARASNTSVTDEAAVRELFTGLVDEFGALDVVVNVAGISRATGFGSGTDEDWARVLDVHLNGYLTVLGVALPLMVAAGHGIVLGVTSGSGWRAADAGAYSCAKRAVASVTWQIGAAAPPGITVNALSPIAATRMVTNALSRQPPSADQAGRSAASGGVALSAAPPPEHLGPIGAYLASEEFSAWCRGHIVFSNGAEASLVSPPHLLEVVRTEGVTSLRATIEAAVPVLAAAEQAQVSTGGSVPRLAAAFAADGSGPDAVGPGERGARCLVVTDDPAWAAALGDALGALGVECAAGDPAARDIGAAGATVGAATSDGPLDAIVVALRGADAGATGGGWAAVLDTHAGIVDDIRRDAAWVRAAADSAAAQERPVRVVTLTDATTPGGRSRAMAAAQLSRAAHLATEHRVDAYAIAVESGDEPARNTTAALAAHLVTAPDAAALSGAELVATASWFGLRSHPNVRGTVTYGGPEVPDWLDAALRRVVAGELAGQEIR